MSNSLYTIPNCISDALILEFCETVLVKLDVAIKQTHKLSKQSDRKFTKEKHILTRDPNK